MIARLFHPDNVLPVAAALCLLPIMVLADAYKDGVVYPLDSTEHQWVLYESRSSTMTIESKGGVVMEYYQVPRDVFVGLLEANLKGGYVRANIEGRYTSQRLSK